MTSLRHRNSKYLIFFLLTLLLNFSLTLFIVTQVGKLHEAVDQIADNGLPSVQTILQIQSALARMRVTELHHVISLGEQTMKRYEVNLETEWARLTQLQAQYEPLISSQEERENFIEFKRLLTAYTMQESKVIPASKNKTDKQAATLIQGESLDLFEQAMEKLTHLFNINQANNARANFVMHHIFRHSVTVLLAIQGLLFLVNIGFAMAIYRRPQPAAAVDGRPVLT